MLWMRNFCFFVFGRLAVVVGCGYFLMVMKLFGRFFILVGFCVLGACADQVVQEKKETVRQDRVVGRVASVYKDGGYLLIQRYRSVNLGGDKVFYVRGVGNEMSSLKVTGERLGQFIAADILNGDPQVGDAVYERVFEEAEVKKGLGEELPEKTVEEVPVEKETVKPLDGEVERAGVE